MLAQKECIEKVMEYLESIYHTVDLERQRILDNELDKLATILGEIELGVEI